MLRVENATRVRMAMLSFTYTSNDVREHTNAVHRALKVGLIRMRRNDSRCPKPVCPDLAGRAYKVRHGERSVSQSISPQRSLFFLN